MDKPNHRHFYNAYNADTKRPVCGLCEEEGPPGPPTIPEGGYYRKKPVIIKAYRTWDKKIIHTLEGDMVAEVGDWIITGIKGEEYPCKDDIFMETYEFVRST